MPGCVDPGPCAPRLQHVSTRGSKFFQHSAVHSCNCGMPCFCVLMRAVMCCHSMYTSWGSGVGLGIMRLRSWWSAMGWKISNVESEAPWWCFPEISGVSLQSSLVLHRCTASGVNADGSTRKSWHEGFAPGAHSKCFELTIDFQYLSIFCFSSARLGNGLVWTWVSRWPPSDKLIAKATRAQT